jgi:hypothetical protein
MSAALAVLLHLSVAKFSFRFSFNFLLVQPDAHPQRISTTCFSRTGVSAPHRTKFHQRSPNVTGITMVSPSL